MRSFPLISELDPVLETIGWYWERFTAPRLPYSVFWLGIDLQGNRWLIKRPNLACSLYKGYREIVFAKLAQKMGWSCQSSVFVRFDKDSARQLGIKEGQLNAAHWFLEEHPEGLCSQNCSWVDLKQYQKCTAEEIEGINLRNVLDWRKSGYASILFGGNDEPDSLITPSHNVVIIDSEQMFSCEAPRFDLFDFSGQWDSKRGRELALEVCREFLSIPVNFINEALLVPDGIVLDTGSVGEILRIAADNARKFIICSEI